jgi:hypothetical protein
LVYYIKESVWRRKGFFGAIAVRRMWTKRTKVKSREREQ